MVLVLLFAGCRGAEEREPVEATPADTALTHRTVTVAMCQIRCVAGDREGNLARIEAAVGEAAGRGADIVCLPEASVLGWLNPDAHQLAHPIPGPDSDRLAALARAHAVHLSVGLAEKDGEQLYDAAVLIDDQGTIVSKHRKLNTLDELMDPPYTRGDSFHVADTSLGRIGTMICADTFVPEYRRSMAALKPDLVLIPFGWVARADAWPAHGEELGWYVRKVTAATGAPAVGTDAVGEVGHGPWQGRIYGGQSYAIDPAGEVLARGADRAEDVVVFEVPVRRH